MKKIIEVYNCYDCPYNRSGHYCDNQETNNMKIGEYVELGSIAGEIHPDCKLKEEKENEDNKDHYRIYNPHDYVRS